jgi:hypothetical protein
MPELMAPIQALLDTSVLVDLWRGSPAAVRWLQGQRTTVFGLPVLVCMEVVDGARDARERQQAIKLLRPYPVVHLIAADSAWAHEQHAQFKLSHNVGIIDALIGSAAARLAVPIYTLNTRHFTPLPSVTSYRPY